MKTHKSKKSQMQQTDAVVAEQVDLATAQPTADVADCGEQVVEQTNSVKHQVDELAKLPKRQRIWEVDFLRGFMILFVVWDHFLCYVDMLGASGGDLAYKTKLFVWLYDLAQSYYAGALRSVTQPVFVTMFVFTAGVSCSFSRNNFKRGIKMAAFALLFTAVTTALTYAFDTTMTINFNVIHVVALSVLLWSAIDFAWRHCNKPWQKNVFGAVMFAATVAIIVVGACANKKPWTNQSPIWFFLANHSGTVEGFGKFTGADYLPFFPDFGWFLVGAFLGKWIYKEKKSIFPSVNPKWVKPITFCGKYSIWIYFASAVVMYAFVYLFHSVWNIL